MEERIKKNLSLCVADVNIARYILARLLVRLDMVEETRNDLESLRDFLSDLSSEVGKSQSTQNQIESSTRFQRLLDHTDSNDSQIYWLVPMDEE